MIKTINRVTKSVRTNNALPMMNESALAWAFLKNKSVYEPFST